jgi:hypothetical protein
VATEADFFIWIRCNALKRPNSAKEKQGKASFFAWGVQDIHLTPPHVFCGRLWAMYAKIRVVFLRTGEA